MLLIQESSINFIPLKVCLSGLFWTYWDFYWPTHLINYVTCPFHPNKEMLFCLNIQNILIFLVFSSAPHVCIWDFIVHWKIVEIFCKHCRNKEGLNTSGTEKKMSKKKSTEKNIVVTNVCDVQKNGMSIRGMIDSKSGGVSFFLSLRISNIRC